MNEKSEEKQEKKKTLGLSGKGTLSLGGTAGAKAKQNIAQSNRGAVVEVRRSRRAKPTKEETPANQAPTSTEDENQQLTSGERAARAKALQDAIDGPKKSNLPPRTSETGKVRDHNEHMQHIEGQQAQADQAGRGRGAPSGKTQKDTTGNEEESYREKLKRGAGKATKTADKRRTGKLTVTQVLNEDYDRERSMSLAAQKRAREKARLAAQTEKEPAQKVFREVIVPETITIQELANRMTERSGDVIKTLLKMGVMATINQVIDADTAELVIDEFGHKIKRVTEGDVESGLEGIQDEEKDLKSRPAVVTVMGHVDHGKTSLLDALRQTDVVAGEAGGITQHIGAYQITTKSGNKITFLDTPGHAAFTEMRSRGANVTDIVILVVSATDSVMPQTIEAINHAKAAEVPIIVAINKIDLPDSNPGKIKQDLLQHELIVEDMGGDILVVEVSAQQKTNLDKLEEAIVLQSELLELKANPNREAHGVVVESKMEKGRGSVATVLVQNGTLKGGDIFVVGGEWGRVRALLNDKGESIEMALPGQPVEVLGLNGTPDAGDVMDVVESEKRAQEISSYRQRQKREKQAATVTAGRTLEDMLEAAKAGEKKMLPVVIKGDVHGSVEAIIGLLNTMTEENEEIGVQVLHSGVGGITESDITLARASGALVIGFNVRANAQARDQAQKESVDVRYYNVIYNVIDDAKAILSGMLSPMKREEYLGQAEIREVFNISKIGKIAGCMVTLGVVKRGAKVRLLRDDVVIHEGSLKTLKRFQDEVKEVKEGTECGMAFEAYDDIKQGDVVECFEIVEEARQLD